MAKLAPIHWRRFDKFLIFAGCRLIRERGDHRVYQRDGLIRPVVVPRDTQLPIFIRMSDEKIKAATGKTWLQWFLGF